MEFSIRNRAPPLRGPAANPSATALVLFAGAAMSQAQSSVRLSSVTPVTEWTKVVTNGDFQAQGLMVGGQHPDPTGENNDLFAARQGFLPGSQGIVSRSELAAKRGVSVGALDVAVHRSRQRDGARLREQVVEQ